MHYERRKFAYFLYLPKYSTIFVNGIVETKEKKPAAHGIQISIPLIDAFSPPCKIFASRIAFTKKIREANENSVRSTRKLLRCKC